MGMNVAFDYHMYGASMGTLSLQVSDNNGVSWNTIWSLTGQQQTLDTEAWRSASVDVNAAGYFNDIKVRFHYARGTSWTGDAALDNIVITSDGLSDTEGFEVDLGDWTNVVGADHLWARNTGGTPSTGTGPSGASTGTGYAYCETSPTTPGTGATFIMENGLTFDAGASLSFHIYEDNLTTPLSVPTGLAAQVVSTGVQLDWNAVTNASSYALQRELWTGAGVPPQNPVAALTESFNTANSTILGPDHSWSEYNGDWQVISNQAISPVAATAAECQTPLSSVDQSAEVDLALYDGANDNIWAGPMVRMPGDGSVTGYLFARRTTGTTGGTRLYRVVDGVFTSIGSLSAAGAGRLKITVNGDVVKGFVDGVEVLSVIDTVITTGYYTGLGVDATIGTFRYTLDNFSAETLGVSDWSATTQFLTIPTNTYIDTTTTPGALYRYRVLAEGSGVYTDSDYSTWIEIESTQEEAGPATAQTVQASVTASGRKNIARPGEPQTVSVTCATAGAKTPANPVPPQTVTVSVSASGRKSISPAIVETVYVATHTQSAFSRFGFPSTAIDVTSSSQGALTRLFTEWSAYVEVAGGVDTDGVAETQIVNVWGTGEGVKDTGSNSFAEITVINSLPDATKAAFYAHVEEVIVGLEVVTLRESASAAPPMAITASTSAAGVANFHAQAETTVLATPTITGRKTRDTVAEPQTVETYGTGRALKGVLKGAQTTVYVTHNTAGATAKSKSVSVTNSVAVSASGSASLTGVASNTVEAAVTSTGRMGARKTVSTSVSSNTTASGAAGFKGTTQAAVVVLATTQAAAFVTGSTVTTVEVANAAQGAVNRTGQASTSVAVTSTAAGSKGGARQATETVTVDTTGVGSLGAQGVVAESISVAASSDGQPGARIATSTAVDVASSTIGDKGAANVASSTVEVATSAAGFSTQLSDGTAVAIVEVSTLGAGSTQRSGDAIATTQTLVTASGQANKSDTVEQAVSVSSEALGAPQYAGNTSVAVQVLTSSTGARGASGAASPVVEVLTSAAGFSTQTSAGTASATVTVAAQAQGVAARAGNTQTSVEASNIGSGSISLAGAAESVNVTAGVTASGSALRAGVISRTIEVATTAAGLIGAQGSTTNTVQVTNELVATTDKSGAATAQTVVASNSAVGQGRETEAGVGFVVATVGAVASASGMKSLSGNADGQAINVSDATSGRAGYQGSIATYVEADVNALGAAARQGALESLVEIATSTSIGTTTRDGYSQSVVIVDATGQGEGAGPYTNLRIRRSGLEPQTVYDGREPVGALSGARPTVTLSGSRSPTSYSGRETVTDIDSRRQST